MTKSESVDESELNRSYKLNVAESLEALEERIMVIASDLNEIMSCLSCRNDYGDRIKALEQVVYQLERRKSNGAHPNDGGWND